MRKLTYFENMRGNLKNVNDAELYAFRAYNMARKLDLSMPLVTESNIEPLYNIANVLKNARVATFMYAVSSALSTDDVALMYLNNYKIIEVVSMEEYLKAYSYLTCCKYGLVFGKR